MFTGIIEETGVVARVRTSARSIELTVSARVCGRGVKVGDSLAVNGCCLTVVKLTTRARSKLIQFDLLRETWNRTNLRLVRKGTRVNLERSLPANGRLGGHFVTGHIDAVGTIVRWERSGEDYVLEISAPREVMRYVVFKGSIAVDGISLTVAKAGRKSFRIWIIPHTCEATALRLKSNGDVVNLEADLLAKYVERLISFGGGAISRAGRGFISL